MMDEYTAYEQAYKNGYEQGLKDAVKHGKWELADDGDGGVCTNCGEDFCNIIYEIDRFKRCPNCGAKMDGGADDANG